MSGPTLELDTKFFNLSSPASLSSMQTDLPNTTSTLNLKQARSLFESQIIQRALAETKGNKSKAAKLLGITRQGLFKALSKR